LSDETRRCLSFPAALLALHQLLTSSARSWGNRRANGYQALAEDGYFVLAERLRSAEERSVVKSVLERVLRVQLDMESVYSRDADAAAAQLQHILSEEPKHEFGVRRPVLLSRLLCPFCLFLCAAPRFAAPRRAAGRRRCEPRGLNFRVEDSSKQTIAEITESDSPSGRAPCSAAAGDEQHHANAEHKVLTPKLTKICTEAAARSRPSPPAAPHSLLPAQAAARALSWTPALRRLFSCVSRCVSASEPVLLVGETGAGKTTAVQLLALLLRQPLRILNCHAHSETSDFVGGYRPTRAAVRAAGGPLFAWSDGPLLATMREGSLLLVDELSLAEDGVLERLNSVLEPGRAITLAERAGDGVAGGAESVAAQPSWRLLATMNPGGDFGKRELSPALRNRFTEVWVPTVESRDDLRLLVAPRLAGIDGGEAVADAIASFWCVPVRALRCSALPAACTPLARAERRVDDDTR